MSAAQAHADYEHRLQEEVNARLLKEQELVQLVSPHELSLTFLDGQLTTTKPSVHCLSSHALHMLTTGPGRSSLPCVL